MKKFCDFTNKMMFKETAQAVKAAKRLARHGKFVTTFWCNKCHHYHLAAKKREQPP